MTSGKVISDVINVICIQSAWSLPNICLKKYLYIYYEIGSITNHSIKCRPFHIFSNYWTYVNYWYCLKEKEPECCQTGIILYHQLVSENGDKEILPEITCLISNYNQLNKHILLKTNIKILYLFAKWLLVSFLQEIKTISWHVMSGDEL